MGMAMRRVDATGMSRRAVARILYVLLLMSLLDRTCSQPVTITSVGPSRGSLAGGTRMHIRGSGFSNNMGGLRPILCLPPSVCVRACARARVRASVPRCVCWRR